MKTCNRCLRTLPHDEFYRDTRTTDGLLGWCKGCKKAAVAQYHEANREDIRLKDRARYAGSPIRRKQVRDSRIRQARSATW